MKQKTVQSGICRYCGCSDALACPDGCTWIDAEHTVCSSDKCVDAYFKGHSENVKRILDALRGPF